MKIRVELLNGNEHRGSNSNNSPNGSAVGGGGGGQCPSVSHIFDGETAVKDHIKVLCSHFKIPLDKSNCYTLQCGHNQQYIEDSYFTPERLSEAEKSYFILRMKPYAIADRVVENLKQNAPTSPLIKDIIFNIRFQLKDVEYVEEFISKGGINQLLDVIVKSRGNTQSYALTALRCFMGYNSGLEEVMSRPQLIDKLYSLVSGSTVLPSVQRQAIELLFVVCNFDGFQLVHRAAKNYAIETTTLAYSNIVNLLASGDMETQLNTLTLFNCLLDNAPNPRKAEKLLSRWKALGIIKILKSQEHVTHSDFKTQLARFQAYCGLGSDSNGRKRALTHQVSSQELEMQLLHYREQQPLISLLCNELKFLRNAIKSAIENGSYINYRAPTERYDDYLARKQEIIGDQPVNINFIKRNDKFTSAFRKSMYVRSPNTSVLFDQSTLDDDEFSSDDETSPSGTSRNAHQYSQSTSNIHNHSNHFKQSKSTINNNSNSKNDISMLSPISSDKSISQNQKLNLSPINNNNNNSNIELNPTSTTSSSNTTPVINTMNLTNIGLVTSPPQPSVSNNNNNNNNNINNNSFLQNQVFKPKLHPTKPIINPIKRMKPLHWTRILNVPSNQLLPQQALLKKQSIWESIKDIKFDEEQFVDLFSLYTEKMVTFNGSPVVAHLNLTGSNGSFQKKPTQKVISVLSQKRSNAISIMTSKLPSEESLIRAIRELDSQKLTLEQIQLISSNLPTLEEICAIQELHSDEVILDKAERWCLMIDGFPKIKPRLKCWEFMLKFEDQMKIQNESIETVASACKELLSSQSILYLFSALLTLGNYMNGGHQYRGQCDGFTLDAIVKMIELKDNINSGSLLDFALKTIAISYQKFNNIVGELPHITSASLISLVDIGSQLQKIVNDHSEACQMADEISQSTDPDDPFLSVIPKFINSSNVQLKSTLKLYQGTENLFQDTIDFFNPQTIDSLSTSSSSQQQQQQQQTSRYSTEKFFTIFSTIITTIKKSSSKRLSQKGFGLKISNSDDPMAVIIEALKTGSPNDMIKKWTPA
ncbi:actin binding protein [Tieghemostelium lacteum]|uniref:Actin binding protein n=1 Tax=Tieghemostelium lacteum TaxID=361077 RepID=A0A151ZC14_TIELA|nr:actin binding protein [Tieghemostelium lacteum]|eukprot:KYQ91493.1 actin binding protein [Tieghemostelium lacteum]